MEKGKYIVAIGGVCFDEYYTADSWVDEGDKCIIKPEASVVGGMIANAACVMAGYGDSTYFVDAMNSGPSNMALLKNLNNFGVNTDYVSYDDSIPDSKCFIVSTPAERTILVVDRGSPVLRLSDRQKEHFKNAGYLYSTMVDFLRCENALSLADELRANGVKLVFDVEPSTFSTPDDPLFAKADIILFNRQGFEKYRCGSNERECHKKLLSFGAEAVVITMGAEGCYGITADSELRLNGIDVRVLDTTGAGDTFNASFVHCHMMGKEFAYALRFANAAASRAVTVMGARGGVMDVKRAEELMNEYYTSC